MLIDGLNLAEGSVLTNATIASGTEFPQASIGELFFRSDLAMLHVFNGTEWLGIGSSAAMLEDHPGSYYLDLGNATGVLSVDNGGTGVSTLALLKDELGLQNLQPLDGDLTAIAGIQTNSGLLRKTAANTWVLDTSAYLTGNQTITVTGDVAGSGATAISTTLASVGTPGTYKSVTTDAKGRVTAGTNPTTLAGYGITDALKKTDDTFTGNLTMVGDIVPSTNVTYNLGSPTKMWKDIYVGPGSIYMNGVKILEQVASTVIFSSDLNQNVRIETSGTGNLELQAETGGSIQMKGTLSISSGKRIVDSAGIQVEFADDIAMSGNKITGLSAPVVGTDAANKAYVDSATLSDATLVRTTGAQTISGDKTFTGNTTIAGNLTISGTTTTVNSQTILLADNILELNSDFTAGTPSENAGIQIRRGDLGIAQFLWDEANDRFTMVTGAGASLPLYTGASITAGSFVGPLTGNATTATTLATPRTINGASFNGSANISFTTDAVAEGSSNLYFTNARASAAAPVQSFNGRTGPIALSTADVTGALGFTPANKAGDTFTGTVTAPTFVGALTGNASTATSATTAASATKLTTARTINGSSFDGTANISFNSDSVAEGSSNLYFSNVRAANAAPVQSVNGRTGVISINSGDVTGALGFTPYNSTNPAGYITSSGSITGNAATATNATNATYATTAGSANAVGGLTATAAGTPNTIVARDGAGNIVASGTGGFTSATYIVNARNPIWRFGNADAYGISYFQGSTGWGGSALDDTIGLHFGTATSAGSPFQFHYTGKARFGSGLDLMNSGNLNLYANGAEDIGDIVWFSSTGVEKHRLYDGSPFTGTLGYRANAGATYGLWHSGNLIPAAAATPGTIALRGSDGTILASGFYGSGAGLTGSASGLYVQGIAANYISGGNQKPNHANFGAGRITGNMLIGASNISGASSQWLDTLWMSTYTGGDVKGSNLLMFGKQADYMAFARQDYDSGNWGTVREVIHSGNLSNYVNLNASSVASTTPVRDSAAGLNAATYNSYVGDSGYVVYSLNTTASSSAQFYIKHNLGNVEIGNLRGAVTLYGNATSANTATTATTATSATSASYASLTAPYGTPSNANTQFTDTPPSRTSWIECNGSANAPNAGWWFLETIRHSNGSNYWGAQYAHGWEDNANKEYRRNVSGGTWSSWIEMIGSNTIYNYAPSLTGSGASGTWGINITGNAGTATYADEARNNYFYVRGVSPSIQLVDTDQGQSRYVHHNGGSIGFLNSAGNWVLRCDDGTIYGTFNGSGAGLTGTAGSLTAGGLSNHIDADRISADVNTMMTNGTYGFAGQPANAPTTYGAMMVARNADVGLQVAGGYNSDNLYFRGWYSYGGGFTPWRTLIHNANIGSQAVASAAMLTGPARTNGTDGWFRSTGATGWYNESYGVGIFCDTGGAVKTYNSARIISNNGSQSLPAFSFSQDQDTGLFSPADGYLGFCVNAQYAGYMAGTSLNMYGDVTAFSDERLKKNWVELDDDFVERWAKVKHGIYDRIDYEMTQVGLSAQSVQEILPNAVQTDKDGMLSLNYGGAAAVASVQLAKKVVDLEAKVARLEALVSKLIGE